MREMGVDLRELTKYNRRVGTLEERCLVMENSNSPEITLSDQLWLDYLWDRERPLFFLEATDSPLFFFLD